MLLKTFSAEKVLSLQCFTRYYTDIKTSLYIMAQSEVQEESEKKGLNFVEEEVFNDLKAGKNGGRKNW